MFRFTFLLVAALILSANPVSAAPLDDPGSDVPKAEAKAPEVQVVFDAAPPVGTKAKCPVMGNVFTVSEDTARSEYKGKHVAYCCPGCKPKFDADPEKYIGKQ